MQTLVSVPGPVAQIMQDNGLTVQGKLVSKYTDLCPTRPPVIERYKMFSGYKQCQDIDYDVVNFVRQHPIYGNYKWDAILNGEESLPYTHSSMNECAWDKGIPKYFPKRPDALGPFGEQCVQRAKEMMSEHFYPFMCETRPGTHEEMLETVNWQSSCGFPFNRWFANKGEFYADPFNICYLRERYDNLRFLNAEKPYYLFSLKDEFRPIEKVKLHKTRVFSAASVDHAYDTGRMFLHQRKALVDSVFKTASCIGIRQTNLDFDRLWNKLTEHSNISELDAANYDGSLMAYIFFEVILPFRFSCFARSFRTRENWNRMVNIYTHMLFAKCVCPDGCVLETDGSMKSGFGLTADDNTLYHYFLICFCYLYNGGNNFVEFREAITIALYGDDNTMSYDNDVKRYVSADKLISAARLLGVEFTDAQATWDNVKFLGHSFRSYNGHMVPVRDHEAIFCGWVQGAGGDWKASVERSAAYRMQAYFHPTLYDVITKYMRETLITNDPKDICGLRHLLCPDSKIDRLHLDVEGFHLEGGLLLPPGNHLMTVSLVGGKLKVQSVAIPPFKTNYMSAKNKRLLANGEITKAEFARREAQRIADKRGSVPGVITDVLRNGPQRKYAYGNPANSVRFNRRIRRGAAIQSGGNFGRVPTALNPAYAPSVKRPDTPKGMDDHQVQTRNEINPVANYGMCLANPKEFMTRIPDAYPAQTALYRSVSEYPIYVEFFDPVPTPADAGGRFAINIQPILGALDSVGGYKVAITNTDAYLNIAGGAQTPDWTNPANYVSNVGGRDPRLDMFYQNMTQQAPFSMAVAAATATSPGMTPAIPFGDNPTFAGYGLSLGYSTGVNSEFRFPPGNYLVIVTLEGTGLGAVTVTGPANVVVQPYTPGANSTDATLATYGFVVVVGAGGALVSVSVAGTTVVGASLGVAPFFSDSYGPLYAEGGAIQTVRPVACSAYFTYMASTFINGGQIAGAYVPGDTCSNNFFSNVEGSQIGQLQYTNNLAQVKGALNGRLEKGMYLWWAPEKVEDTMFLNVSDMAAYEFPCLTIAGNMLLNPQAGPTPFSGTIQVGRLEVVTVYEFRTILTLYESITSMGSTMYFEAAWRHLCDQSHVFENPDHWAWIKQTAKRLFSAGKVAGTWAYQNRETIMPLVRGAAMLTL